MPKIEDTVKLEELDLEVEITPHPASFN